MSRKAFLSAPAHAYALILLITLQMLMGASAYGASTQASQITFPSQAQMWPWIRPGLKVTYAYAAMDSGRIEELGTIVYVIESVSGGKVRVSQVGEIQPDLGILSDKQQTFEVDASCMDVSGNSHGLWYPPGAQAGWHVTMWQKGAEFIGVRPYSDKNGKSGKPAGEASSEDWNLMTAKADDGSITWLFYESGGPTGTYEPRGILHNAEISPLFSPLHMLYLVGMQ